MPKRVALLGFYGIGNFGDDLMTYLFAEHLAAHHVPYSLFSLRHAERDSPKFEDFPMLPEGPQHDPEPFLESCELAAWGGGGLLVSWPIGEFRKRFLGVEEQFDRIAALANARGIRRSAFSVGGWPHRGFIPAGL